MAGNTVGVDFVVKGAEALRQIEQIAKSLRDIGGGVGSGAVRGFDSAAQAATRTGRAADQARDALGRFTTSARQAGAEAEKSFDKAHRSLQNFSGVLKGVGSTVAGFVVGNVLTGGFSLLVGKVDDFIGKIRDGASEAADAQLFLRSAISEVGGSFSQAEQDAKAFALQIGTTTAAAERLRATAEVGLQGTGRDPGKFLRSLADLSAARGIKPDDLTNILTQTLNGADEGLGRLFAGRNPSSFFNDFAKAAGRTADSLTDVERRTILVNAIMDAGAQHVGAAGERLHTLAGEMGQLSTLTDELANKFGQKLGANVGVKNLFDRARDSLLSLVSNDSALDAFAQKVADTFVKGANIGLDLAASVGRGVDEIIGLYNKASLAFEKLLIDAQTAAQTSFRNIQIFAINALEGIVDFAAPIFDRIFRPLDEALNNLVNRIKRALDSIPFDALEKIPGIGDKLAGARESLAGLSEGLSGARDAFGNIGTVFDDAKVGLEGWRKSVLASAEGQLVLERRSAALGDQIGEVDKKTEAAKKATTAYFDSFRPGLEAFRQFSKEGPDTFEAVGGAATKAAENIKVLEKDARSIADAFADIQRKGFDQTDDPAAKFADAFEANRSRIESFKDKTKDLAAAIKGPLVAAFSAASENLLSKNLERLRGEIDATLRQIDAAENKFLGRDQRGANTDELRNAILAAQGLGPDGEFIRGDRGAAGKALLDLIGSKNVDVSQLSIDAQSLVAQLRTQQRGDLLTAEQRAIDDQTSRARLVGDLTGTNPNAAGANPPPIVDGNTLTNIFQGQANMATQFNTMVTNVNTALTNIQGSQGVFAQLITAINGLTTHGFATNQIVLGDGLVLEGVAQAGSVVAPKT